MGIRDSDRDRSCGKNGSPVNGICARPARIAKNTPKPASVPVTAATADSTVANRLIWRGVAPTSRIAANRCSRRAAERRVAVPMKINSGKSRAADTTERVRTMPLLPMPIGQSQVSGETATMRVTSVAPSMRPTSSRAPPTTTISESGEGRAASPSTAVCRPGKRSRSWSAGWSRSSRSSAGETTNSPGPGSAVMPGGTGPSGPETATSTRAIGWPWK